MILHRHRRWFWLNEETPAYSITGDSHAKPNMRIILSILLLSVSFTKNKPWPPAATGTCGLDAGGISDSWEPGVGICLLDCTNPQDQLHLGGSSNWNDWW